ncbi:fimbrillin family protein [Parabacteroides sp.]|uniref:fimbrillin family protein n=1 Tax=Parabacteroides sp. TaxID=1869337 RepID=UPI00257E5F5D|nr:fimbrillin family protein [Parabacteroides sp.]
MRKLINYKLIFLSSFFLAACSNEDNIPSILPSNQPDAVELGITAGVTLTKSAVTVNTGLTGGIAVYAGIATDESDKTVDPYTSTLKNNYAIYTSSNGTSWATAAGATDKIYLTSEKATIFAHYPAYSPIASGQDDAGAL